MKYNKPATEIPCNKCGKTRLVKTNGMLLETYIKTYPLCRSCGAKNAEDKIKKGWFTPERLKGNKYAQGHTPWNKGLKGIHLNKKSEFEKGYGIGEKNNKWKGDNVGYFGLHSWVQRKLGIAKKCSKCGSIKNVQWANKSWKYKRDTNDWIELCFLCHRKYDMKNWGIATKKFNL